MVVHKLLICEIMSWQELINHFRISWLWSCEITYHALSTFLHDYKAWQGLNNRYSIDRFHVTSSPSRLRRKTRHAGVRDKSFYGDLHKMSDILIMLLIYVELDKIQLLHKLIKTAIYIYIYIFTFVFFFKLIFHILLITYIPPTVIMVLYETKVLLVTFICFCPTDEQILFSCLW